MRDMIFKLRVLAVMLTDSYRVWRQEYVGRDLDNYYCCSGLPAMECGCQGSTLREYAEWSLSRAPDRER